MIDNLGATTLRRRRRSADPLATYDALPAPLRQWLAHAALPWSPTSCKRIWDKAQKRGQDTRTVLEILTAAEQKTLSRDKTGFR